VQQALTIDCIITFLCMVMDNILMKKIMVSQTDIDRYRPKPITMLLTLTDLSMIITETVFKHL
jgi:hypothetical protein